MRKNKDKNLTLKKLLYWLPRILSVLFIIFISMFAFDVFDQPQWFLALVMHLVPSFILILLTVIAWKHEKLGGLIFIVAGFLLLISSRFESLIISIPAIILGALFLGRSFLSKS